MAKTPETSDYTSIKERIRPTFDLHEAVSTQQEEHDLNGFYLPLKPLAQFDGNETAAFQTGIPFALEDYLELVDWTGRIVKPNKRGAIPKHLPPILKRLEINPDDWLVQSMQFEAFYNTEFRQLHVA